MSTTHETDVWPHGIVELARGPRWLALAKPSGLLAVPGRDLSLPNVLAVVRTVFAEAESPHRLDMDTSGAIVVALDRATQAALSAQFVRRGVAKRYVAMVAGRVADDAGVIDLPIGRRWEDRPRRCIADDGKPSQTRYTVTRRDAERSRVELEPLTGRTHQLRVHLAAIGHPILGDPLYSDPQRSPPAARLMLHASWLAFACPDTGETVEVEATPPF